MFDKEISRSYDRTTRWLDHQGVPPEPIVGTLYYIAASRPSVRYVEVGCMNDRPKTPTLTLIGVENGMFDLSLHTVLTPPCFAFFWGIIQTCNRFKPRFKNPFTLTVAQAMAAGGGVSRQAVWDKQQRLMKVRIDGVWLVKITPGSRKDNTAAKYKINYNLIVGQMLAITASTEQPSNIIDEPRTIRGRSADDPLTILRSDQKRGEEKDPPSPPDVINDDGDPKTDNGGGGDFQYPDEEQDESKINAATALRDRVFRQYEKQLEQKPDIGHCKDILREFGWESRWLSSALNANPTLDVETPSAALNLIAATARRLRGGGSSGTSGNGGGISGAMRDELEQEIQEMEREIEETKEYIEQNPECKEREEYEKFLEQTETKIIQRQIALGQGREEAENG